MKLRNLNEYFKGLGIPPQEGYAFSLLFEFGLQDYLIEKNLIDSEKAMALLSMNLEGDYELIQSVIEKESNGLFLQLKLMMKDSKIFDSKGHVNNPQDYEVIGFNKEVQDEFDSLKVNDVEKAFEVIKDYYKSTKPAKKLVNYLKSGFMLDYDNL